MNKSDYLLSIICLKRKERNTMKREGKNKHCSLLKKLREEGKIDKSFELSLDQLSLEDLIALKLELASKHFGSKLYGLPIFHSVKEFVNDALLKYSYSASPSKREGAAMLGLSPKDYRTYLKKYQIESFFKND